MGLGDKVIVITGAASGIGLAIAREAVAEGVGALVLTDRGGPGCNSTAAMLAGDTQTHTVIADLRARDAAGSIVNILSMNAHCGIPDLAIYAATKGAMATLTRNAANAHIADLFRVNGINLGWVATASEHHMQSPVLGCGPDWMAQEAARLPSGRLVSEQDSARLAVFLPGDASVPMSGAIIDFEQKVAGAI